MTGQNPLSVRKGVQVDLGKIAVPQDAQIFGASLCFVIAKRSAADIASS